MTTRRATRQARRRASRPGHALPYAMAYREPWRRFTPWQRLILHSLESANRSLQAGLAKITPHLRQALGEIAAALPEYGANMVRLNGEPIGRLASFPATLADAMTYGNPGEPASLPPFPHWKPCPHE